MDKLDDQHQGGSNKGGIDKDNSSEGNSDSPKANHSLVEWDAQGQPLSTNFNDIYFSKENGLAESRYVFLDGNQLQQRFSQLKQTHPSQSFTVAETGFGTGLNFLSCWQLWQQYAPSTNRLTFISVEKYPLSVDELEQSLTLWPELKELSTALVEHYCISIAPQLASYKKLKRSPFYTLNFGSVRLILIIDDAEKGFKSSFNCNYSHLENTNIPADKTKGINKIDAWFLDGFAPSKNPDMWTQELFTTMSQLSHSETTVATFTAAGHVRRGLVNAGFAMEKCKGFGNKREMMIGKKESAEPRTASLEKKRIDKPTRKTKQYNQPWAINRHHKTIKQGDSVAIIGAGLAGCHTAYSLAQRGIKTTLIDAHSTVATEASGNPQGIIYGKLSAHEQMLNDFNLSCLLYAQQHYQAFWQSHPDAGAACGVMQLSQDARAQEQHRLLAQQFKGSDFLYFLSAPEASKIAGIQLKDPALFFPHCGWLKPQTLCQWLISSEHITTLCNTRVQSIEKGDKHSKSKWRLSGQQTLSDKTSDNTQWEEHFDYVIIANANAAKSLNLLDWLPTKPIRGQISYIPSQSELTQLKTVICSEGYIAPASTIQNNQQHAIGASYNLNNTNSELSEQDHSNNLQQLNKALKLDAAIAESLNPTGGRVGFRCTSPDYLPLVGPVPNVAAFKSDYQDLSRNAHRVIPLAGEYYQGLYLNIAHGSRGLAYTPLSAEILACTLTGEALPLSQSMADALNPARFIIRELCRTNISS